MNTGEYLNYQFKDDLPFIQSFDEAPLWSAAFGLLLLKHLPIQENLKVLDIGTGTGFPLFELAGRMGNSCHLYGLDNWSNAINRAKQKATQYQYSNFEFIEASAEQLPFTGQQMDLIVSNLGINNFAEPKQVFEECSRVLKIGGKLAITSNLNGHWKEFYSLFYQTLKNLGKEDYIKKLAADESHRNKKEELLAYFTESGFQIQQVAEELMEMKFVNGSAFLNHHFVKTGWLSSWLNLFPQEERQDIFIPLEKELNAYAKTNMGLTLSVPMIYVLGIKI